MRDIDSYDHLVNMLYDAALQVERWPAALQAVAESLDSDMFHSFVWDFGAQRPLIAWATPTSATSRMHDAYDRHFGRIDPRRHIAKRQPVGQTFRCHDHIDEHEVGESEFYQDFLLPNGLRYMIGVALARESGREASLALLRARGRKPYSDEEGAWAQRLSPHLQRALALLLRQGRTAEWLQAGEHALDALNTGVLLLNGDGAVVYANRVALALFPRYFISGPTVQRLTARSADGACALDAAWQRILANGLPQSVLLPDAGHAAGSADAAVTLCRVPSMTETSMIVPGSQYLVFLTPMARRHSPGVEQLAALFNLTPAEARLAQALSMGQTLAKFADRTGVKRSTVRSQLLEVLAKTGAERQQDLVAMLARLPVL